MAEYGKAHIEESIITDEDWKFIAPRLKGLFTQQDIDYAKKVLLYLWDGKLKESQDYLIRLGKPEALHCLKKAIEYLIKTNQVYSRMTGQRPKA